MGNAQSRRAVPACAPQNTDLSTIHPGLAALLFRLYMRCASSWARFFSQSAYSALPFGATSAHRSVLNRYFLLAVLVGSAHALSDNVTNRPMNSRIRASCSHGCALARRAPAETVILGQSLRFTNANRGGKIPLSRRPIPSLNTGLGHRRQMPLSPAPCKSGRRAQENGGRHQVHGEQAAGTERHLRLFPAQSDAGLLSVADAVQPSGPGSLGERVRVPELLRLLRWAA